MAMTGTIGPNGASDTPKVGTERLELATIALRSHVDDGWTSAWQRTLDRLVTATRRTRRVSGSSGTDGYFVSDQVVAICLRSAVDAVASTQVLAIDLSLEGRELVGLRLEVSMAYGTQLRARAAEVRQAAQRCLADVLGEAARRVGSGGIEIHIADLDAGDPPVSVRRI